LGDLRTQSTHIQSGTVILSDAPTDNHGKGEAFSPTDLAATSLGSCAVTTMAIAAKRFGVPDFTGMRWTVQKHMAAEPRRIAKIELHIDWDNPPADPEMIAKLKDIALNCPVAKSLHPDLHQVVTFGF